MFSLYTCRIFFLQRLEDQRERDKKEADGGGDKAGDEQEQGNAGCAPDGDGNAFASKSADEHASDIEQQSQLLCGDDSSPDKTRANNEQDTPPMFQSQALESDKNGASTPTPGKKGQAHNTSRTSSSSMGLFAHLSSDEEKAHEFWKSMKTISKLGF